MLNQNIRSKILILSRFTQSFLYIVAGINHFKNPEMYYKIIPPFMRDYSVSINVVSGGAEILLGICLLFPKTRAIAAMGLIALLLAVFPANIYLAIEGGAPLGVASWMAWLRLPIQFILIYWAYYHWKYDNK